MFFRFFVGLACGGSVRLGCGVDRERGLARSMWMVRRRGARCEKVVVEGLSHTYLSCFVLCKIKYSTACWRVY